MRSLQRPPWELKVYASLVKIKKISEDPADSVITTITITSANLMIVEECADVPKIKKIIPKSITTKLDVCMSNIH